MCIVIICFSVCGDINFKINLICLTKLNYYITKKSKIKDLENKESFQNEIKKISVLHPEEIWGQHFSWESALHSSIPAKFYWFSCVRCSFEQNTRKLLVYLRNLSENKNSFFLIQFWGHFFWVPITFECYHFQSGCNPGFFIYFEGLPLMQVKPTFLNMRIPL